MVSYQDIAKANESIETTPIKGKEYAEVPQRIRAFRMLYPEGFIVTDMLSNEDGVCVFRASVGYYEDGDPITIGVGTAYEKENSTFINKTSYIENCETSAVGRALGMAGIGIDTSVASAEEVQTAILNQMETPERTASEAQIKVLTARYKGANLTKLLEKNNIDRIEDLPMAKASEIISKLREKKNGNDQV